MRIEHDISPVAFNTWIKPLTVYSVEGHTITILVNNELEQTCSYIKKKASNSSS
ncbi:MAG: DnaA N-terminal domain-containing protein [Lachnospiraceae bacterium]